MTSTNGFDPAAIDESQPGEVAQRVGRGAAWSLLNNSVLRLGSLISGIVMARLLTPEDFGVFAIALVALTLLQSFNELGVSLALVRWQRDVREIAATVMTISMISSTALYAIIYFAAPAFCDAMGSPDAVPVLRLLCVAVVIDGVATVPVGLLNRFFMQRQRFIGDAISFSATTAVTITLAANGYGPISFAWGTAVGATVATVVFLSLAPIKVRPGWKRTEVPGLLRFGLPLAGASLLVLSVSNVDKLIVGVILSQASLGFYLIAFNLSSWPLTVFSEAARRVSLAGFSRMLHDPPALSQAFARGLGLLMAASIPVCVLLASYAAPILRFVYGDRWAPAAAALPLLAILGLLRVALFVCYDLFVALGKNRLLVGLQALWLVTLVPVIVVGTNLDGIRGAAAAHVLVAALVVTPAFFWYLQRLGIHPGAALAACRRPALGGLLIAATAFGVRSWVDGSLAQLLVGGVVAGLVYLPVVWPMRSMLPGRAGRRAEV